TSEPEPKAVAESNRAGTAWVELGGSDAVALAGPAGVMRRLASAAIQAAEWADQFAELGRPVRQLSLVVDDPRAVRGYVGQPLGRGPGVIPCRCWAARSGTIARSGWRVARARRWRL